MCSIIKMKDMIKYGLCRVHKNVEWNGGHVRQGAILSKVTNIQIDKNSLYARATPVHRQGLIHQSKNSATAHYDDVIMDSIASQITSLTIVYPTVHSDADQSKHQSSASLAFVWEIHRWPVNFPHKWPVTRKMFPFDDVIMWLEQITHGNMGIVWYVIPPWASNQIRKICGFACAGNAGNGFPAKETAS